MLIQMERKHDIICWTIAIGLHLLLLRVNFDLSRNIELERLVPIVEVDYIIQEEIITPRQVRIPGRPAQTFKEKVKYFFSKEVVPAKKEELLAGKAPSRVEVNKTGKLSQAETLTDKKVSLPRKVDLSMLNKSGEELMSKGEGKILFASQEGVKLTDSKTQDLKDKGYKVAKKDLPFQVASKEEIRGEDMDIVAIHLGKETSKGILTEKPSLKDIKGKGEFSEGVFRVVKQGGGGKLSGSEVLANLLVMAKEEEERKSREYESLSGSGVGIEGGEGSGIGSGGQLTRMATKGSSGKEVKSAGKGSAFSKGVVFSRAPRKEEESASGSGLEEDQGVARKEQRGRVIFEIRGPLSRRTVLYKDIPSYPEWAEKEGIEAGVSIHFVVLSTGEVKDNIYVVRTSGYPVLDKLVMEALRNWEFASLQGDLYGKEEWGVLTFYFSLNSQQLSKR
ncbi:energy transducer TonB [bacterium]|nr:energy transducer TonB [bacterium]